MKILGLDIATRTGWCIIEDRGRPATWRCGTFKSDGDMLEKCGQLAKEVYGFIKERGKPDFIAIEMVQKSVTQFRKKGKDLAGDNDQLTINPNAMQLAALAGSVVGVIDLFGIPYGQIAPNSWRSYYYPKGMKPDGKWTNRRIPKPQSYCEDWKDVAIKFGNMQGILLPKTKAEQRDAAEACGIACAWQHCSQIPEHCQQGYMKLRSN